MTDEDPYLAVLSGIGYELSRIADALEDDGVPEESDAGIELICRCGYPAPSEAHAQEHAVTEHNAPPGAELEIFRSA